MTPRANFRRTLPDPEALAASRAFQEPATPPPTLTPPETAGPGRGALVSRLLAYPGDWRRLALVLLDTRGPEAFTNAALLTLTAIADALEYKPTTEPAP